MGEIHRAKDEGGARGGAFVPFLGTSLTERSDVFTNLEVLRISSFQSFYNSISSPPSIPKSLGGGAENSHPLVMVWSFGQPAPILRQAGDSALSHVIGINSGVFRCVVMLNSNRRFYQWIAKFLGALCQKPWTKSPQIFFHYTILYYLVHKPAEMFIARALKTLWTHILSQSLKRTPSSHKRQGYSLS